jgi:hypothetical protein
MLVITGLDPVIQPVSNTLPSLHILAIMNTNSGRS